MFEKKNVLLLCHYYPGAAGTIIDHIQAFNKYSANEYFILSNLGDIPEWLELSCFDAILIHYSLIVCYDNYISPVSRNKIREFSGFKGAFVQDDYRWINDTVDALSYMKIQALFPLTEPEIINKVYDPYKLPNVRKETVLAGYVPEELVNLEVPPYEQRILDVGYRARKLPAWMGSHTLQKWKIADKFLADSQSYKLKVDISYNEEDRIYGEEWIKFISNCKATLGTESGASVCDFTGQIQRAVESHLEREPNVYFETLRELYFESEDGKIMMNVISPRCFESAALRTLMILYEGKYSDVLTPWRHYVPLKRDHSNMNEVVRIIRSPVEAQKIINQAYDEVARNEQYSYAGMVKKVDRIMNEEWSSLFKSCRCSYMLEEFEWYKKVNPGKIGKIQDRVERAYTLEFKSVTPSFDTTTDNILELEFPLGELMEVKFVAVSWNLELATRPRKFDVKFVKNGKNLLQKVVDNSKQEKFCSLNLAERPKVDLIAIRFQVPAHEFKENMLTINILSDDTSLLYLLRLNLKPKLIRFIGWLWMNIPEVIRNKLRPLLRPIRQMLF